MKTKWITKQASLPESLAISLGVTVILALSACAIIATMILKGKIHEDMASVILRVILALSVLVGVKINLMMKKEDRFMFVGTYTVAVLLLTLIASIALDVKIKDFLVNMLFVLCGVGTGLLIGYKKTKKHAYSKKRYC